MLAQQHLSQFQRRQRVVAEIGHGGGRRYGIHLAENRGPVEGFGPGGHQVGEGTKQHTACKCGVHKVSAQTAIELLDHNNGESAAQNRGPVGGRSGQAHSQQKTGDAGGQIPDGIALACDTAVGVLKQDTGGDADGGDGQNTGAEEIDRHTPGGQKSDQHVPHDGLGGIGLRKLRGDTASGGIDHLDTSSCLSTLRAERTTSTRGMLEGQM